MVSESEDHFNGSECQPDTEPCYTHVDELSERLKWFKIIFLVLFLVVFVCGVVGNSLVCLVIWKNKHMRTVTNVFILNLAIADLLVLFVVVIPTMTQDIFETWFFGEAICKIIFFFQRVSVIVSILTLTVISVERYYAICHPLSVNTAPTRVVVIIIVIWALAIAFASPELVFLGISSSICGHENHSYMHLYFHIFVIAFYVLPLLILTAAYIKIAMSLWVSHVEEFSATGSRSRSGSQGAVSQLIQRRRAAKMLIAVVVCFFLCYFMHNIIIMLMLHSDILHLNKDVIVSMITTGHLLVYVNSAANPIIYNFMSEKFRAGFVNVCSCIRQCKKPPTEQMHLSSWHDRSDRMCREETRATEI